jgi:hypothetical protein
MIIIIISKLYINHTLFESGHLCSDRNLIGRFAIEIILSRNLPDESFNLFVESFNLFGELSRD